MTTLITPQGTSWVFDTTHLRAIGTNETEHKQIVHTFQDTHDLHQFQVGLQIAGDKANKCFAIF